MVSETGVWKNHDGLLIGFTTLTTNFSSSSSRQSLAPPAQIQAWIAEKITQFQVDHVYTTRISTTICVKIYVHILV